MKSYASSCLTVALALAPVLAIPPDSFDFPDSEDDTPLSVTFQTNGSALPLQPGALFGIDVPAAAPSIAVNESYESLNDDFSGQYLLLMLDPDASYPENPQNRWIIHWWQEGLTKSTSQVNDSSIGGTLLTNSSEPRVAYRRPRPPTNSSAHRYITYLFEQPANFQIPEIYSGFNATNGSRFPFERFVEDADLNDPVAANYFYCSNQTDVPDLFVAAAGQQYPGGNGAMITEGTNLPSQTAGSPSATSGTMSGSASASVSAPASSGVGSTLKAGSILAVVVPVGWWALL